jgi:hypothetical protein
MAELCAFVGTPEMAKALYAMTLPYAELWGNIGFGSNTYGPVGRQLGMLALRAGELDAADAHLEAALRSSERAHSPTFTALICGVYAQSALRRASAKGKRVASEMLERAQALNLQHGFHGNAAWVRYIAKRAEIELTAT